MAVHKRFQKIIHKNSNVQKITPLRNKKKEERKERDRERRTTAGKSDKTEKTNEEPVFRNPKRRGFKEPRKKSRSGSGSGSGVASSQT